VNEMRSEGGAANIVASVGDKVAGEFLTNARLRIENKEFTRQRRGKDSNPRDPFEPNGFQAIKNRANRSPRWRRRGDSNPETLSGLNGFQGG